MLRNIKSFFGEKLGALDGEIGHVKDLMYDDQCWVIRYLVADTGSWIPGRQVILSPYAFTPIEEHGKVLSVALTRRQIEDSPSLKLYHQVTRDYEISYHQYFGWPFYWQGTGLWGMNNNPLLAIQPLDVPPVEPGKREMGVEERASTHLQSVKCTIGFHAYSNHDSVGQVTDFLMDDRSWAIRHLVVETRNLLPGKKVLITPDQIQKVSYEDLRFYLKMTKADCQQAPIYDPSAVTVSTSV